MKGILSIQDLSCVGRCSTTVALPVLSAMGLRCSVLPTAILSTHTGFDQPYVLSLTQSIGPVADHWKSQDISFDGILIGYLSDPEQAAAVLELLDRFPGVVILDPVMGDGGKAYSRITPRHIGAMKKLCQRADVVLPNVTEAALLTGLSYEAALENPELLPEKLLALGAKDALVTGVEKDGKIGFAGRDGLFLATQHPKRLHGTGDLFAAVFAGAFLSGKPCRESGILAAQFVGRVVENTPAVTPFGPEFETQLPWLWDHR